MTTEPALPPGSGLRALVYGALPPHAAPTETACHPIHRHVLDNAQGDIVELIREKMSAEFGNEPHVVITIKDGDLDPAADGELIAVLDRTAGGMLVFGVSYRLEDE